MVSGEQLELKATNHNQVTVDLTGLGVTNTFDELLLSADAGAATELNFKPQQALYAADTELMAGSRSAGDGTIAGNLFNLGGLVAPKPLIITSNGPYAGTLSVQGNFLQDATGMLQLRLAGTNANTGGGSQYDQVLVDGVADLVGTVAISLLDPADPIGNSHPYQPQIGDVFDILKATQINSDGLILQAPALPADRSFSWAIFTGEDRSQTLRLMVTPPSIVNNTADDGPGSLRQVARTAIPGEVITFAPWVIGTITLTTGELLIATNLTITGPTNASVTVSGNHSSRIFHFNTGSYAGSIKISNLTINNGNATGPGAGIFNETGTFLSLNNCTISGNNSGDSGGGIANNGLIVLTNCTISGNQAVAGGGLYNYCGTMNLWCCTVASNSAPIGGGFYNYPLVCSYAEISGTLIAGNSASSSGSDLIGSFTSSGYNLIGQTNGLTGSLGGINQLGSIASPLDPRIGPLQNNGGPTFTHALLAWSPALNTGSSFGLTTDQRGSLRPLCSAIVPGGDGSDIGAYEYQFCPTNLLVINTNDNGAGSLRQAIALVEPGGLISFASNVTGLIALTSGELLINKDLAIAGPTATPLTINGNNTYRVFHLTGGTVSLSSLTIANGNTSGPGGGFFSATGSTLILNNSTVSGNNSDWRLWRRHRQQWLRAGHQLHVLRQPRCCRRRH